MHSEESQITNQATLSIPLTEAGKISQIGKYFLAQTSGQAGQDFHDFLQNALTAAYLQGYMECDLDKAGKFHLEVEIPISLGHALKLVTEFKFCLQTAYSLGRMAGNKLPW